jgi:hypothetical protein
MNTNNAENTKSLQMQLWKTKQYIIPPVLAVLITFSFQYFPEVTENQYAYSQPIDTNSTVNAASNGGVGLTDIHPSPLHLKSGSKFQIIATVVNNSPSKIAFTAGVCDSPLSAQFLSNVVIRYTQGCTATSPPFELNPGELVSVAGPSSDTIYQALAAGQATANVTFHYQTDSGLAANITKPFVFTIS